MLSTVASRFTVIVALILPLCVLKTASAEPSESEAKVVARLYQDYAWQAIVTQSDLFGEGLASASKDRLERYFSPDLARLLVADSACQARTGSICNLDFDLLFDSQDPRVADLYVERIAPGNIRVRFSDPVTDQKTLILFKLAKVGGEWRVADIVYQRHTQRSLKTVLSQRDSKR